jgi:hypothetical protein
VEEAAPEPAAEAPAEEAPAEEAPPSDLPPEIATDAPEPPVGVAGAPQPGFDNVPGVKVNRLPTIGGSAPEAPAEEAAVAPAAGEAPAILRNAVDFENPEGLPLLSIVLIDVGEEAGGLDPVTLSTLPGPLTIAVDTGRADAAARAAAFRAAGFEVAMLAPEVPDGAAFSDVEVTVEAARNAVPEAVAVIARPESAFQSNRLAAQHFVALLADDGLGLATYARGLNPAEDLAAASGLAYAPIWRMVDEDAAQSEAIGRALDRAAFEAAQGRRIVVTARSVPETVTALFGWLSDAGEKGVAVAPFSAAVAAQAGTGGTEEAAEPAEPPAP